MPDSPMHHVSQMRILLEQAMDASAAARSRAAAQVDDETLALVAEGRADELSEAHRRQVLEAIAGDAELARLVHELSYAFAPPHHDVRKDVRKNAGALKIETHRAGHWVILSQVGWAIAACLLLAMGVWRLADPPAPLYQSATGEVRLQHIEGPPSYWDQLERDRLEQRYLQDRLRDYALVAASVTCLGLSVPSFLSLMMGRRRRA